MTGYDRSLSLRAVTIAEIQLISLSFTFWKKRTLSIIESRNEYAKDVHVQTLGGVGVQKAVLEVFPSG